MKTIKVCAKQFIDIILYNLLKNPVKLLVLFCIAGEETEALRGEVIRLVSSTSGPTVGTESRVGCSAQARNYCEPSSPPPNIASSRGRATNSRSQEM